MQCRQCNYPLWNIRGQCPECGTPFVPSEFEFARNRVEFCCPHCAQPYYGTDERGHLVPPAFTCVSCEKPVSMDEMTVRPAPGVHESAARSVRMPWLDRGDRSATGALVSTIGLSLVQPGRLIQAVPEASPLGPAWKFAIVTNALAMVVRMLPAVCIMALMPLIASSAGGGGGPNAAPGIGMMFAVMGGALGAGFVVGLVIITVSMLVWPLVCHAALRLTGGAAFGLRRTTQAILYASGANASTAIPCLNDLGGIWWIVSAVLMVRRGQNVHGGRATFAVLVFPALLLLLVILAYGAFVMAMFSGATIGGGGPFAAQAVVAAQTLEIGGLVGEVRTFAWEHDGRPPPHAAALVSEQGMATGNLIATGTETSHQTVFVGGVTLSQLQGQGLVAQRETAARAAALLPAGTVAHRLGDFVFTYHGIEVEGDATGLWVVVLSPDPDLNPGPHDVVCATFDGDVSNIPPDMMGQRLAEQNALRADAGLAPLPDPSTVTHREPAAAERGP